MNNGSKLWMANLDMDSQAGVGSEVCSLVASSKVVCCQFGSGNVISTLVASIPTVVPAWEAQSNQIATNLSQLQIIFLHEHCRAVDDRVEDSSACLCAHVNIHVEVLTLVAGPQLVE